MPVRPFLAVANNSYQGASLTLSRQTPTSNTYQRAQQEFSALFQKISARRLGGGPATSERPTRQPTKVILEKSHGIS